MKAVERVPVVQQVVTSLKAYIQEGNVKVGDKLPTEMELCEMLSVGRGTVREATRILQATGFVEIRPGRGAFVIRLKDPEREDLVTWFIENEVELKDVIEVRMAIEPLGVKLAIQRAKPADIKMLRAIQTKSEEAVRHGDTAGLALCDEQFHTYIMECSRNRMLVSINRQITACLKKFRNKTFYIPHNVENFIPAHEAILKAFECRDSMLGEQSMREHLERVDTDLENSKKR
nr:FadR/GntR family transcriptional regulator [Ruthenibacterium lactatiformans]